MSEPSSAQLELDQQPQDILESLDAIKHDLNAFVSCWVQRLDRVIETSQPIPLDDSQLQMRADQLRQERRQWEADCEVEQMAAQERMEQLTHAWLQLESEQRAFLQIKSNQVGAGSTSISSGASLPVNTKANSMSVPLSEMMSVPTGSIARSPDRHGGDAAQQFEKLRREMDSGRCGNGQH
jgi:hypothetical protein